MFVVLPALLLILLLQVLYVIQSFSAAQRRVHFVSIVEQAVIHLVLPRFLLERHEGLETMTPQNFAW
jgi:hypothetical protein